MQRKSSVNRKYIFALVAVVLFVVLVKLSNPYRKYSTHEYWQTATVEMVAEIPAQALQPGNRNGGVLMWAAMATSDPQVLTALVDRGADINEADGVFKGTPLTAAAAYTAYPAVIDRLIELGAVVDKRVHNDEDALMLAARYNQHAAIIERLILHGADVNRKNEQGETALDLAVEHDNAAAKQVLMRAIEHASDS